MTVALYTHVDMFDHRPGANHPECSERLAAVAEALSDADDLDLDIRDAPLIDPRDLLHAHTQGHIDRMFAAAPTSGLHRIDDDTLLSPGSLRAARRAAGAVVEAVRAVGNGGTPKVFCAVRPPGHHAGPDYAMGFCIFSNVALGARVARLSGFNKVAVVDFDVHHGNGTQAILETDPSFLFASIHQSPNWPGTGDPSETGVGNVTNVTVPPAAPREVWRAAFETLMTRVDAFAPDLIMVSAGFDAHAADPLAEQLLEAEDFGWATRAIVSVAEKRSRGRIVSSLEGGYDLAALGQSALAHVRALQGG